jgi:putative MATE family efflux protein
MSDVAHPDVAATATEAAKPARTPVFVTGSTMRHVVAMTATGSVGLMAIFLVDFLSLLYVSWLGRPETTAGVGFATLVLFLSTSVNIGFLIAVSALMSKQIGAGSRPVAREVGAAAIVLMLAGAGVMTLALMLVAAPLLAALGARGEAYDVAHRFLMIALPSNLLMALGMGFSGALRAVGDARRAMYVTLSGGVVTAGLDPLLIFTAGLGPDGAAWATVVSRLCFALVGFHGAVMIHAVVARPSLAGLARHWRMVLAIAAPAVLTNIATPIASVFVAGILSRFGDKAVAAIAIIDRIVPLAFGVLFALSGAVGPILGQNWGAGRYDRMRMTLRDSTLFCALYVLPVWALLVALQGPIIALFGASGLSADLIALFLWISGPMWLTLGGLFVANAAFNNLGFPLYSTAFNWGRATIGTLPLAMLGAWLGGAQGVLIGVALGGALFGLSALWLAFRVIEQMRIKAEGGAAMAEKPGA